GGPPTAAARTAAWPNQPGAAGRPAPSSWQPTSAATATAPWTAPPRWRPPGTRARRPATCCRRDRPPRPSSCRRGGARPAAARRPAARRLAMAAQLRRDLGIQAPRLGVRIEEGEPAAGIERVAEELGADLVVTGVARDEPFGRYLLGGTVERLVRRMPVPVLVARTRPRPYRQVLVASDLSEPSR